MSNPRPRPATQSPAESQQIYDYYSQSKMAQQPQKPQRSLWDREPADVANMPPVYTQEYVYKAPAQPQPTHLMTDGKGAPRELVYVQQQKVEKKHNKEDVALGCCAGCAAACCCCSCSVM
ncbi:hypothetical protein BCIN_16g04230 [Botrytis cinerea B05.10]|uniref:Cysteine-rich transmembrane domain-containing protein n=2 Tax=Botryotinia fuckeliana TaxID=40559 RepID=A0A384K7H7_BOTFB|nr:hypothetical protein BCIN_16g04230 [Botrytis cinerea B05.10]ATZ58722.1 hypothetical protein BCIN_16g04230 [Botrytis cinerea B05.10]